MRARTFTFKKTKRIKVETTFRGISIDLTVGDAEEVLHRLREASRPEEPSGGTPEEAADEMIAELMRKLEDFVLSRGE